MADPTAGELNHPVLNLIPEEKRVFGELFKQADTGKIGVVTGEDAVKFFEKTRLPSPVLGQIWQIADTENRGLLTKAGFCQVLRLIGHYQAGRDPSPELAFRPGPLPKFEGVNIPPAPAPPIPVAPTGIQPQLSGGPIRVPSLAPEKAAEYASLFEKSGAQGGLLPGENAKQIFEKSGLSNEMLGRIWNLADTEQRGALGVTEFVIAMHLLASFKTGAMKALPSNLPAGLYEAASRRGPAPNRITPGIRPPDSIPAGIPRQFSGQGSQRTSSPLGRAPFGTPQPQATNNDWLITPQEKISYDNMFSKVDKEGRGYLTGDQAVLFFSDSGLTEETLASIWDLADINSQGQLSRDEFAVAMYLIKTQRKPGHSLPATLPSNLVPPGMRNQPRPTPQTTAPQFNNAAYSSQLPKSAAEDLFGLDAFSTPASAQAQQSTGGSASFAKSNDADPFGSKASSPTSPQGFGSPQRGSSTTFKPFMPTSSFGQNLTAHSTSGSATSSMAQSRTTQPQVSSAMDDLLGDNDPEVNKKLTPDTTELANMSNQISNLRNQMQEVQQKKSTSEADHASASTQKRDLEVRLSQFRTQYEQEVRAVKVLEDRLASVRNESRRLQQEHSMIEATYQDLQNQHRQYATSLDVDQREIASLKEKIRLMNAEINQLRPQLEKMKSDSRQQRGLVAINKKQLETNERDRDKIKEEMASVARPHEASRSPYPTQPDQSSAVASPAPSTTSHSTNPFFRKSPPPAAEKPMSPSGFARDNSQRDFDNVFSSPSVSQSSAPPPTTFRSDASVPTLSAPQGSSVRSSEPDVPTPSTSPPLSSYHESPQTGVPPAPPESRQFGSNFLPLREGLQRGDSFSSSVKVQTPASRYGSAPGNETPTMAAGSLSATPVQEKELGRPQERGEFQRTESNNFGAPLFDRNATASPAVSATSDAKAGVKSEDFKDSFQTMGQQTSRDIPGAFPGDMESPIQPEATGGSTLSDRSKASNRPSESFSGSRGPSSAKVDFDAAFAGFGVSKQSQERQDSGSPMNGTGGNVAANKFNKEFPPIEEFGHDEESDSNSEKGFADNFTNASPQQKHKSSDQKPEQQSTLPAANAQKSPPTYDQSVAPRSGPNQFPPEFGGLLPSRQDPTSPRQDSQSPEKTLGPSNTGGQGQALFGGSTTGKMNPFGTSRAFSISPPPADTPSSTVPSDAFHSATSYQSFADKGPSPPPQQSQTSRSQFNDDFDTGFDDLAEAAEADDKTDDDFMISSHHREGFDEFNPVFDSPAASKSNTLASQQTPTGRSAHADESFGDFDHLAQSINVGKSSQSSEPPKQDWEAIFSGMSASQENKLSGSGTLDNQKSPFSPNQEESSQSQMPHLARALSAGTEHDDPLLKDLTSMGFKRSDALAALERFDYNTEEALKFLTASNKLP